MSDDFKLYVVAVVELAKKKKDEEKQPPKLVLEPTSVIARSEQDAAIKTVMSNDKLKDVDKDRIEVLVRPF